MEELHELLHLYRTDLTTEILLYMLYTSRAKSCIRSLKYGKFILENFSSEECLLNFRFDKPDIVHLTNALHIPEIIKMKGRYIISGINGICILLRRLAYSNRLGDIEKMFGLSPPILSVICNSVTRIILRNTKHLLLHLNNNKWLDKNKFRYYAQAISNKGAAINNCWAFIDGTVRAIARPIYDQKNYYSGHKRQHCLKYQSVICPDGITISLHGPYAGRRHDAGIFEESGLYQQLQECAVFGNEKFILYGDAAYPILELILKPYPRKNVTPQQEIFNRNMSSVRQCVEWNFGKTISLFAFLDFKKKQKLFLQDVELMYYAATILSNCHTCLYKGLTSLYFNIEPPTLEEYLQL